MYEHLGIESKKKYNRKVSKKLLNIILKPFKELKNFLKIDNKSLSEYKEILKENYYFELKVRKDALIRTYPGKYKIVSILNIDSTKQYLDADLVNKYFMKLPECLSKNVKKIHIVDYENPLDLSLGKIYKIDGYLSFASARGRTITFYRNDGFTKQRIIKILSNTLIHESAHILDLKFGLVSTRSVWKIAQIKDSEIGAPKGVSDYATKTNAREDFADSVVLYLEDKENFIKMFPNRAAVLAKKKLLL